MKAKFKLWNRSMMVLLIVVAISCSKDESPDTSGSVDTDQDGVVDANDNCPNETGPANNNGCPETIAATTLSEVVASGDAFENFPLNITETEVAGTETTADDKFDRKESSNGPTIEQRWVCTEKEVDITGGTHTFPLYNTNASVIWPGNLLQGKTLDNGTPTDIVVKRAGGTITYNLITGNPVATVAVDVVNQGTVQQAMNDIIAQNGDITPANFTLDVVAVNSSEQLALEMGLKASTLTAKVSSDFSLDISSKTSSVLVKLTQQYYTMSYVKPTSLDEVFDSSVAPEQLTNFIQPDNPATFISSVTYGRIFYMLYESTASAEDMEAALKGSYNAVAGNASASVDIESLKEYNNLSVKVIAYGGDSQGTLNAVGAVFGGDDTNETVNNLQDIVGRLAESSDISGGLPLSYVVNSLEDPSQVVSTNLATRYTVKNCELKGIFPPVGYQPLVDIFKTETDEGGIGAMFQIRDGDIIIFNKAGTRYAWYDGNAATNDERIRGMWEISDPEGPIGGTTFDSIGACTRFSDTQIYIFNDDGLAAEIFNYTPTASPEDGPIGTYSRSGGENIIYSVNAIFGDSGGFPYTNQGFTAGARFDLGGNKMFFGDDGSSYALYNSSGNGSWGPEVATTEFGGGTGVKLFEKVGASTFISFGGASGGWLFINDTGEELMEYKIDTDSFNGPWVIN
ncbi:hypothetical protein GTQ34_14680 [Muricauda sp. JGD-17]|uniref:Thiol-activated cytolysin n=1 Tax=Flagellimonas ochracea TaxID=2696472 RepID=A0A964WYT6_9FLAO|nr:thiol-activated cytolysin family protein [Allomuricauda ochracea]NAY93158.1 hypothetical protein [Allomuricauda ochracea]